MKKTILPADTYLVSNRSIITEKDKKIITMLYQPIIGNIAVSLYFTLMDDLDKLEIMGVEENHHHLMSMMQLGLEDILIAREKLEAIGLLKTYYKKDTVNQYVYLLFSPISANEFFSHPILNIVLYNNLGKSEYEKVLNYFKIPKLNLKDYEDITCSFHEVFSPVSMNLIEKNVDIQKTTTNSLIIKDKIDFNLLIESIPKKQLHEKCFSNEVRELINNLSYIYQLDTLDMQGIVRNSLNEKGLIDKAILRKSCRDYYQFDHSGNLPTLIYNRQPEFLKKPEGDQSKWAKMVYTFENITPYQFLKAKYKGAEPTDRDKKLVESLLIDQKLKPGVVNVLLSYVLKVNQEQLTKSFVETIAGQWKRLNIETVEDAMKYAEKMHKSKKNIKNTSLKSTTTKVKNEPIWLNEEQKIEEVSEDEKEEFDRLLKELV